MISQRTSAGLQAAKAEGVKLGNQALADANDAAAARPRRGDRAGDAEAGAPVDPQHGGGARASGARQASYKAVARARVRLGIAS